MRLYATLRNTSWHPHYSWVAAEAACLNPEVGVEVEASMSRDPDAGAA